MGFQMVFGFVVVAVCLLVTALLVWWSFRAVEATVGKKAPADESDARSGGSGHARG